VAAIEMVSINRKLQGLNRELAAKG
jgi:hypothetical protein